MAVALACASAASAGVEGAGTRAAGFLATDDAPAALGMAGAVLAQGSDVQGAAFNPAALGWLGAQQMTLAHTQLEDETSREWLALGTHLGRSRTVLGLVALAHDEGTIDGRDAQGQSIGELHAQDLALSLQLARTLGAHASIGGAAHVVNQRIAGESGAGFAFDLGAQWRSGPLSLGLAGRDFGGGMYWQGEQWRMPARLAGGIALEHEASGLGVAADLEAPADYYRILRIGAQWRWRDRFALRAGWRDEQAAPRSDELGGPSFGFGAGLGACWLDYGYTIADQGLGTHRIGLSLRRMAAPAAPRGPVGPMPVR
jgi:hypothetical protein